MNNVWAAAFALQWAVLITLTIVIAGILRYLAVFQEQLKAAAPPVSRLEIGDNIPNFRVAVHDRTMISTDDLLLMGKNFFMLFVTGRCPACSTVLQQAVDVMERIQPDRLQEIHFVMIFVEKEAATSAMSAIERYPQLKREVFTIGYDGEGSLVGLFGVQAVPVGLYFDRKGSTISQSLNPHANWLYASLNMARPVDRRLSGFGGPTIQPAITLHQ